ncbi:primosomal protein DnaI [Aerococcus urinae]|uniref:Primosomal protein DnaI n=1 Tax=Aerococcus mictus TaxID=2976810 RepID=A0A1E9PH55_9LACT|nr:MULTISPECIES: primosomal protein DnaI [Aerococcus]KAA9293639.1 primosomal protein DnaI [Aerococcus mictus]MBU5609811.1 primosomal protein DnaI [Aerococcus urinae]MCY3033906.1 primosomal protein DnaI [Aerococcus mictus]MCY3065210.1 primosomal protein DnaI [Aerococcus mictus]MCY3066570.1 primosomal protein DnaI [Aerococcus mictus]
MRNIGEDISHELNKGNFRQRLDQTKAQVLSDPDVRQFIDKHKEDLDQETIDRSISKLYEFVQEKERIRAGKRPKFPNFYPKLIMNFNYIDIEYQATDEFLAAQKEREKKQRVTLLEMPKDLKQASFQNFDLTDPKRQAALEKAIDFVEAMQSKPKQFHQGLYLHGPFGVGKSYLAAAVANHLAEHGFTTTLFHYPTFISEIKSAIKDNRVNQRLKSLQEAQVLMIDDIGAESNSAWVRDEVLGVLLQNRMSQGQATFFTSNFSMQELENHLAHTNQGDSETVKAQRIMERVRYLSEEVTMSGRNRRYSN